MRAADPALGADGHARSLWIFTHDSVALGEDGPTHQPVEHLAAMRAIPNLTVIRPATRTRRPRRGASILEELDGPCVLVLSRQNLPILDRTDGAGAAGGSRAAPTCWPTTRTPSATIVATGSEVALALEARDLLADDGVQARVVSMPSWELFAPQDAAYRDEVLPPGVPKISVEAGIAIGWAQWVDASRLDRPLRRLGARRGRHARARHDARARRRRRARHARLTR